MAPPVWTIRTAIPTAGTGSGAGPPPSASPCFHLACASMFNCSFPGTRMSFKYNIPVRLRSSIDPPHSVAIARGSCESIGGNRLVITDALSFTAMKWDRANDEHVNALNKVFATYAFGVQR